MSEESLATHEAADVEVAEAPDGGESQGGELSPEDRARAQGWVPKEEFRGDPDRWTDAETFVKRADNELPIARSQIRRMEKQINDLNEALGKLAESNAKAAKRDIEQRMKAAQQARADAIDTRDSEAFTRADAEMDALKREAQEAAKAAETPKAPPENPAFDAWAEANPWYGKDKAMTAYADSIGPELANQYQGNLPALYKAVGAKVKEEFAHKFANPNKRRPAPVEGASQGSAGKGRAKSAADLPADAKAALDRNLAQIPESKRDWFARQYVKTYFAD